MCSFEDNTEPMCSWSHDNDADFQWRRVRADQINSLDWYDDWWTTTGPDRDHTLGKIGFYLKNKNDFYFI
jgi:hypothetical protein